MAEPAGNSLVNSDQQIKVNLNYLVTAEFPIVDAVLELF